MATWHQSKNPCKLYHETLWTVVIDPPNNVTCCMLFETRNKAEEYIKRTKTGYILKPANQDDLK